MKDSSRLSAGAPGILSRKTAVGLCCSATAVFCTKIVHGYGFDSIRILFSRGEIRQHESKSQEAVVASSMSKHNCSTTTAKTAVQAREFREPGFCYFSAQCLWKFCGELRRFADTATFPCKMTQKYCGDLRRRRIHARTAQENAEILARETP